MLLFVKLTLTKKLIDEGERGGVSRFSVEYFFLTVPKSSNGNPLVFH